MRTYDSNHVNLLLRGDRRRDVDLVSVLSAGGLHMEPLERQQ